MPDDRQPSDLQRHIRMLKVEAGGRSFEIRTKMPAPRATEDVAATDHRWSLSRMDKFILLSLILIVGGVPAVYVAPNAITGLFPPIGVFFLMIAGFRVRARSPHS